MDNVFARRDFLNHRCFFFFKWQIRRLEFVHNRNFVHRDVKPDNFLMGVGRHRNRVHLIDFGLAKKFRDSRTFVREREMLTSTTPLILFIYLSAATYPLQRE